MHTSGCSTQLLMAALTSCSQECTATWHDLTVLCPRCTCHHRFATTCKHTMTCHVHAHNLEPECSGVFVSLPGAVTCLFQCPQGNDFASLWSSCFQCMTWLTEPQCMATNAAYSSTMLENSLRMSCQLYH